jgi:hypothetical protein
MRDTLEDQLASRLRAVADTVDDELPTPVDLELRVRRYRRRKSSARRWSGAAVAAAIVVVVGAVAVVHGTDGHDSIHIETSPTTDASARDSLAPGTVMLSSHGKFVQSLDAHGVGNATMVQTMLGNVTYARVTADHRAIWYLSFKDGPNRCGEVVRANIHGQSSKIVTKAEVFDISPDGRRLAMFGAGNLADGQCTIAKRGQVGEVAVVDVDTFQTSIVPMSNVTSLRWSPDGSSVVAVRCALACAGFSRIDVPSDLGPRLAVVQSPDAYATNTINAASAEFGPDGLYALVRSTPLGIRNAPAVDRLALVNPKTLLPTQTLFSGGDTWRITQVVPTTPDTYIVAAPLARDGVVGK